MYPLFVKQIKTQRAMTALQPKIKELQAKHKGDKETLNVEMMKLYKEHNANPFAGCLPVLLQMPIFIALFQVLKQLQPSLKNGAYVFPGAGDAPDKFGITPDTVASFMKAKIFGAPIGAGIRSKPNLLEFLGGTPGPVKAVGFTLIVLMAATTFVTSKQMMGRNTNADTAQATQQKVLLYVMPLLLGLFGLQVAVGVLIYWTTTNLFSMGQQAVVMRHLGPPEATLAAGKAKAAAKAETAKKLENKQSPARGTAKNAPAAPAAASAGDDGTTAATPAKRPANRPAKNRGKGQRRGGRR
jgi:YidC/Oxa1 family membrane protein insertase